MKENMEEYVPFPVQVKFAQLVKNAGRKLKLPQSAIVQVILL